MSRAKSQSSLRKADLPKDVNPLRHVESHRQSCSCHATPFITKMLSERLYDGTCVNTKGLRADGSLSVPSLVVFNKFTCFFTGIGHIWQSKRVILLARLLYTPPTLPLYYHTGLMKSKTQTVTGPLSFSRGTVSSAGWLNDVSATVDYVCTCVFG